MSGSPFDFEIIIQKLKDISGRLHQKKFTVTKKAGMIKQCCGKIRTKVIPITVHIPWMNTNDPIEPEAPCADEPNSFTLQLIVYWSRPV